MFYVFICCTRIFVCSYLIATSHLYVVFRTASYLVYYARVVLVGHNIVVPNKSYLIPHPRLQAAEHFQQQEVEARLQPWPRMRVTEHTRHMPSESVRSQSSLTTPPSRGCDQPHDHSFGTAFPPPLPFQKGQLGKCHHYPRQWYYLSRLAIAEGIQILQWPSPYVCPQMHPTWLQGQIHIRPNPRLWWAPETLPRTVWCWSF